MKLIGSLFFIVLLAACNETQNFSTEPEIDINASDVSLVETASTLEDLAELSPVVITAKASGVNEEFVYKDVTFYKTKVKVKDVLRDEDNVLTKNSEITILQNDVDVDPRIKKNESVLLYLVKYKEPVIEDAYRIVGLMQGHFKFNDDGTITSKATNSNISKNTSNKDLKDVKTSLDKVPYVDLTREPRTQEEIDKLNEAERQLPEQSED